LPRSKISILNSAPFFDFASINAANYWSKNRSLAPKKPFCSNNCFRLLEQKPERGDFAPQNRLFGRQGALLEMPFFTIFPCRRATRFPCRNSILGGKNVSQINRWSISIDLFGASEQHYKGKEIKNTKIKNY
jgi:hypothetical protein